MFQRSRLLIAISALALTGLSQAATFTPAFSDYSFPGSQFTVDAAANAFFYTNYGIDITNAYLYVDSRDTFDGIGIANGTVAELSSAQTQAGHINFIDTTDFVTINYLAITGSTYSAFDASNHLLDSFTVASGVGTGTLHSSGTDFISSITFTGTAGYTAISGLTYNFDGHTGGGNTDLPPTAVPEPATWGLMLAGLAIVGSAGRKRKTSAR